MNHSPTVQLSKSPHRAVAHTRMATLLAVALGALVITAQIASAAIVGPYTSDGNTLHLYHFDEVLGGSVTTNNGSAAGNAYSVNLTAASATPPTVTTVLGASAYSGFGNAANLNTSGYLIGYDANGSGAYQADVSSSSLSADAIAMSTLNMGNGGQTPFTLEAMIAPTVINQNQEIICTDSSASSRGFQFKINSSGQLQFQTLNNPTFSLVAAIPTTGPNAFVANNWYHVAAVYDGANVTLYWTKVDPAMPAANQLNAGAAAIGTSFGTLTGPVCVGGENRAANGEYFRGLIDEVRISKVARAANGGMLFSSAGGPAVFPTTITPTNSPIYAGSVVTLSAVVAGTAPFSAFTWQTDGGSAGVTWTNLPGSTTNSYAFDTTGIAAGTYRFRLAVTDAVGSATNLPASLTLAAASGPIVVQNTTVSPASAPVGGNVVLSATFDGTRPIYYQWLFTDTNGVTSFVPGATTNVFTLSNVQFANAGKYSLMASNNPNGIPTVITNTPAGLTVHVPVIISAASTAPVPGSDDVYQLASDNDSKFPDGINYYDNNGNKPGQTFTTGTNPNGYVLNALYYLAGGPVVSDGSHSAGTVFTLRIYSMSGSSATLLSTYVNDNTSPAVPNNTWVKWTGGVTNTFLPNASYAYSISSGSGFMHVGNSSNSPSLYTGGELALIPTAGGTVTFGASHNTDAAFLINIVPTCYPAIQITSISPANSVTNPVYGGQPVTLSVQAIGCSPLHYVWQSDNGSGGAFSDIAGSDTNIFAFDTTTMSAGTYQYQVIVSNSLAAATSSVVTLNLLAASAPVLTTNTILTPTAAFVGNSATMRAGFSGTPTIAYQWKFDDGSGPKSVLGATNNILTIASVQLTNNGYYFLTASNGIAPYTNASSPVLFTVATPPATNAIGAGLIDGGNSAPPVGAYDIAQLTSVPPSIVPGINYYVDNSSPPGQTFTTGTNPPAGFTGYPLNSIWLQEELSTVGSGGNTPQAYTLGIYQLTGTNAFLITSYVSSNTLAIVEGDWIQWVGLTNVLQTNTTYAFSLHRNGIGWWKVANDGGQFTDLYTNGQSAVFPASGAGSVTYSTDSTVDSAFLIGLTPPGPPIPLQPTQISPPNCYAGDSVFMQAAFSGSLPIHYQWQFWDTNGVGPIDIPGATNFVYTISSVAHSNAGTYSCVASNYVDGVSYVSNSIPGTLTVPLPPTYFVSDYSYSTFNSGHYSGPGVIGAGTYWNTIDTSGRNQTGLSDDGFTDLSLRFTSTRTWDFAHGGGIDLLDYYMLNQGSGQTTFGLNNLPNGVYNLVVYACNGHYEYSQTAITVGGVTQNALATSDSEFVPGMNYVVFTNIVVTNGTINGLWQKAGTSESALNGVQVELGYAFENPAVNITTQPTNVAVAAGQPASFTVVASGPPPLSYQWRANGTAIPNATNSVLMFAPPSSGDTVPNYDVIVSSPSSGLSATSSVVTLTIRSSVDNLVWRGYGMKWDLSSGNWMDATTFADPAPFQQGDNVLLDDSTPINQPVYLIGRIMPGSVTVANTNYTLNGPGYLSWNMGLNIIGGGRLTLATVNDYTGNTALGPATTLTLTGAGSIGNSATLIVSNGATVNVTGRTDGTLTLSPSQTLKGDGTYNVTGALVNNGTLEFNVVKSSGVVTNDRLQGMTAITYGGTLKLDLSGDALVAGDSVKLFNATTYSGSFNTIVPATPGTGLVWNTNALTTSGTLSVSAVSTVNTAPTNITVAASGGNLTLTWPADHTGWRLQSQTNGLGTNWFDVLGANTTNQIVVPIDGTDNSVFFRMVYP
jgi:hypothetical protein